MAVAVRDIGSLVDSKWENGHRLPIGSPNGQAALRSAHSASILDNVLDVTRRALAEKAEFLKQAERLCNQNKADPKLVGYEDYSDELLLTRMDQLAMVSEIHLDCAEYLATAIDVLENLRGQTNAWCQNAEETLQRLRQHKENIEWVVSATRNWSEELGREYDRRHPDLPGLPFEPIDMGPTNSARLPPVL